MTHNGRERFWYFIGITSLRLFVRSSIRLTVFGAENIPKDGPSILIANHVSYLDPLVIFVIARRRGRKVRAVAVNELFEKPVIGNILRAAQQIPVGTESGSALREAGKALARNDLVLIYPEGTIPTGKQLRPRRGAAVLAVNSGAPVVPIVSQGLERRRFSWRRRRVIVSIRRPIKLPSKVPGQHLPVYAEIANLMIQEIKTPSPQP